MNVTRHAGVPAAFLVIMGCALGCGETPDPASGSGGEGGNGSASSSTGAGAAAADCANPASVILDEDNWACTGGKCEYTGCNSTQECIDAYNSPNYVCKSPPGLSIKSCFETCAAAADCANPATPILDVDNWTCNGGACEYTGCNSTQECIDAYSSPNYVCQ